MQELSSIERAQREITEMKNQQLKTIEKMKEAKRNEKVANETNAQLLDKVQKLESELATQKLKAKELKVKLKEEEKQNLKLTTKVE